MNKLHRLSFLGILLCLLAILVSSVSIYGKWTYYADTKPTDHPIYHGMGVFDYPPEEVLPGGDENEEVELGGNHYVLVDLILNERDKSYGLNLNTGGVLHTYVKQFTVVYSNQKVSGGNLKFVLDPKNDTHGLYFCLQWISDTEYHAYTFSESELMAAEETGGEIPAYKTVLLKTDIWRATTSHIGYATVKPLSALGANADPNTEPFSIDVTTWHF